MGLPRAATAFRFGQGHFEAVFNFYFNRRRDQKRARQIWGRDNAECTQLLQKFARNHENTKGRNDTNSHVLNWKGPLLGVQKANVFTARK